MESIKECFLSLIIVLISAGLINIFAPEGKGKMDKYVKYTVSLAVLAALCIPLKPAIKFVASLAEKDVNIENYIIGEYSEYTDKTNKLIISENSEKICEGIKKTLFEKFEIPEHECDVELETKKNTECVVNVTKINIFLSGYSLWKDPREIEKYIYGLVNCACEVSVR